MDLKRYQDEMHVWGGGGGGGGGGCELPCSKKSKGAAIRLPPVFPETLVALYKKEHSCREYCPSLIFSSTPGTVEVKIKEVIDNDCRKSRENILLNWEIKHQNI